MAALRTEYLNRVSTPAQNVAQSQLSRTAEEEFEIESKPRAVEPPTVAVPENPQTEKYQSAEPQPKIDARL